MNGETTRARRRSGPARDRILGAAERLFYRHGLRAVGVDTIVAESGVAKMTLYRHFPSKDHLIAAYLERSNESFRGWMEGILAGQETPRMALEALFEGVAKLASSPECLGCAFIGASVEYPAQDHLGHQVALAHKQAVIERLQGLAKEAGARDPRGLAEELLLLMDGAWSAARVFGARNHASRVGEAAKRLIGSHLLGMTLPA